jgi:hypothetical protein
MPRDSLPVEYLFTVTAKTSVSGLLVNAPQGTRVVVDASTGSFEGPRAKGIVKGPGGDWLTLRADGTGQLDVRLLLETDDGAVILMIYKGIFSDGGKSLRTAPQFETGDERYAWLNNVQAVGIGSVNDDQSEVSYEVYALR